MGKRLYDDRVDEMRTMIADGATIEETAKAIGCCCTTLYFYLNEERREKDYASSKAGGLAICAYCGAEYTVLADRPNRKWCSDLCRHRAWRKANPERARAKTRRYRVRNPEKGAEWRATNPGYFKEWAVANPERTKELGRASQANRRARKKGNGGSFTADGFNELCEAHDWKCIYCGDPVTMETVVADHIVPVTRGGDSNIGNIAPACSRCNSVKGTKSVAEFMEVHQN